jgi:hypothetical protein
VLEYSAHLIPTPQSTLPSTTLQSPPYPPTIPQPSLLPTTPPHPTRKNPQRQHTIHHGILPLKPPHNDPYGHDTRRRRSPHIARSGDCHQYRKQQIHEQDDTCGGGVVIWKTVGLVGVHLGRVDAVREAGEGAVEEEGAESGGEEGF